MFVITGATGNTGGVIAETLLAAGAKVRVVGRDANRLARFTRKGAETVVADVAEAGALQKAFSGAKAVYVMIPPNAGAPDVRAYQERVSDEMAAAIEKNGVPYAVVLSSYGAEKPDKTGPVVGLHSIEKKLGAIGGLNALFFRAGYFMENLLAQVGVIQAFGFVAGPVRADLALPLIATRDIGAAAAEALSKLDFSGKQVRELQGAGDVSYLDAVKIIGKAIGRVDLAYQQLPSEQLKPALIQMGMSPNMADLLLEMSDALNSGHMKMLEPRSGKNTTATTLETFVGEVFVPAFRGKGAGA